MSVAGDPPAQAAPTPLLTGAPTVATPGVPGVPPLAAGVPGVPPLAAGVPGVTEPLRPDVPIFGTESSPLPPAPEPVLQPSAELKDTPHQVRAVMM